MILEPTPREKIEPIIKELERVLKAPTFQFQTKEDIADLTDDGALEIMRYARRTLVMLLLHQEHHEHMGDDCGDYLEAATFNWNKIWRAYWDNDGVGFTEWMKSWLLDADHDGFGGCDGEIRMDLLSDELQEEIYGY